MKQGIVYVALHLTIYIMFLPYFNHFRSLLIHKAKRLLLNSFRISAVYTVQEIYKVI